MPRFFPLAILLLALAGEGWAAGKFYGTDIGRAQTYARNFRLTDHDGRTRTLDEFRGKAVVLFFGYLQCPNICPLTLQRYAEVMALLGEEARRVQVLFITLDPERDAPALREYVTNFHPDFIGLHDAAGQTAELALSFRVYYRKVAGTAPGSYHIDHAAFSYAYDPAGRLRLRWRDTLAAAEVATDLRKLLGEPVAR